MPAVRRSIFGVAASAMWIAAIAISSAQQAGPGDRKVWDGVYTSAQAARGKAPFERSCARCHNIELAGSQRGPALKGGAFWSKYENDNLATLYMFIRDNMPQDGPSLVTDEIKADVLAYIMSMNGMPAGSATCEVVTVPGNHSLKADLDAVAAAVRDWLRRTVGQL